MNKEKIIIIAVKRPSHSDENFKASIEELISLSQTAGGEVVEAITQNREQIHGATYVGKGKIDEIKASIEKNEADLVICNDELTPGQLRNLSNLLDIRLIDRSQLILDIFAGRAKTKEGKLQVELAQLEYTLPRLHGKGIELSRLGGGIGTRGPGETKLETDQRHIRTRIHDIKKRLKLVVKQREQYRKRRQLNGVFQIALVGYTNAGKSTIFNKLTSAESLVENKLFATLDPLTRQIELPSGFQLLITDTVGFIEDLPTQLIAAFRSTLEEVAEADLIVHVVNGAHPDKERQEKTVMNLLKDLEADTLPILTVYNKKDLIEEDFIPGYQPNITISAINDSDIEQLLEKIEHTLISEWDSYIVYLNPEEGKAIDRFEKETIVNSNHYNEERNQFVLEGKIQRNHPLHKYLKE